MNSKCPQCQKEIEHEDYLFEVRCECGTRFNPFFDGSAGSEPTKEPSTEPPASSESQKTFQDIVSFGEGLRNSLEPEGDSPPPNPDALGTLDDMSSGPLGTPPAATPRETSFSPIDNSQVLVLTGSEIPSKTIQQWLPPISVQFAIEGLQTDPLEKATEILKSKAQEKGANAIVSLKVWVAADLTRGLLFGIPVQYV